MGPQSLTVRTRWLRNSSVHPEDTTPCIEPRCRDTGDGTHVFSVKTDIEQPPGEPVCEDCSAVVAPGSGLLVEPAQQAAP